MKKKWIEKTVILLALTGALLLFAFFLKDIMVPLFSMELKNDVEGARDLLTSKGIAGGAAVSVIEALQMIVIFIPAEFIQVSSGLSYPFYIAAPLCDLGVCLGATIIFLLVRTFRFNTGKSRKTSEQIEQISSKRGEKNVQMLMYLLFISPIIPFGAICYYAASTEIRYRRYIFTVATGVIPSIITSNLIGASARAFIMNALPLWLLVLIIIFMMGVLFVLLWLFLEKVWFRGKNGTPDSASYFLIMKIVGLWRKRRQRLHLDNEKLKGLKAPFVVLCNHESTYDFYYVSELFKEYKLSIIANQHVFSAPVLRHFTGKAGMIPKKMFYPDTAAVKMLRMLRAGYPVVVFPEGRLSEDGCGSPIVENAAPFYRRVGYPLVIAHISDAYFCDPKWRKRFYRGDISVSVKRILTPDELKQMTDEEVENAISEAFVYNESEQPANRFRQKKKAQGLENMLYRCADCGALYTTQTKDSDLYCTACGKRHHLDESYHFTDEIGSIPEYYRRIRDMEHADTELTCEADVKIFPDGKSRARKDRGVCTLNKDAFTFRSETIEFSIPTEKIPALAFSCNAEFELYYKNELYFFYPVENRRQCVRWSVMIDLFREERIRNGQE